MLLLIDNFDSFTFNLEHLFAACGAEVQVLRADLATPDRVRALNPSHIVISPGPKGPDDAPNGIEVIRTFGGKIPLLGVCLGQQMIARAFGGTVVRGVPTHGKTSSILHSGVGLFRGLPNPLTVARYHSLTVRADDLPSVLEITATCVDGVMALRHRALPCLNGIQFHPESFLSAGGEQLAYNFLRSHGTGWVQ